ncbi:hypothetical protein ACS127_00660 [Amphibacillus sp. Q70]|uniref:hypothetical protein n=1 Tax=Amphibacillus sp. Q70 TaxID=3453416 RepID=UPI003F860899
MLNIIRADFFRMTKSKSTWIILITALAITIGLVAMLVYLTGVDTSQMSEVQQGDTGFNVTVNESLSDFNFTTIEGLLEFLFSSNIMVLFIIIFSVFLAGGHNKTGYIKNMTGIVGKKYKLLLSESLIICFFTAVIVILITVAASMSGILFFEDFSFNDFSSALPYLGIQFILMSGLGLVVAFFTEVVRSNLASLVVWIMYGLGLATMFFPLIDKWVNKLDIVKGTFSIREYLILGNIEMLTSADVTENWLSILMVPLIISTIGFMLSAVIIEKQDVK